MLRNWAKHVFAILLALSLLAWPVSLAQDFTQNNKAENLTKLNLVSLESQLISGLRLTNAGQKQYVRVVLAKVQTQEIPRSMVNVVYRWSLGRNPRYPFPYFRIAMNTLASRRGVSLP